MVKPKVVPIRGREKGAERLLVAAESQRQQRFERLVCNQHPGTFDVAAAQADADEGFLRGSRRHVELGVQPFLAEDRHLLRSEAVAPDLHGRAPASNFRSIRSSCL